MYSTTCDSTIYVPNKTKNVNVKVYNMMKNTLVKHISYQCKCKFDSTTCESKQKWNNKACQCLRINYRSWKKDCNWKPSTCICENGKYLKTIVDAWDEIIYATDSVSTNVTSIVSTNITGTTLVNSNDKKVRYKIDCYILRSFISDHITIHNRYYLLSLCKTQIEKTKGIDALAILKWGIMNLMIMKFVLKQNVLLFRQRNEI